MQSLVYHTVLQSTDLQPLLQLANGVLVPGLVCAGFVSGLLLALGLWGGQLGVAVVAPCC